MIEGEKPHKDTSVNLHIYGLDIELRSDNKEIVESIWRDFAYFKAEPVTPTVSIEVFAKKPSFRSLPDLPASIYTVNYICYQDGENEP